MFIIYSPVVGLKLKWQLIISKANKAIKSSAH